MEKIKQAIEERIKSRQTANFPEPVKGYPKDLKKTEQTIKGLPESDCNTNTKYQ